MAASEFETSYHITTRTKLVNHLFDIFFR